jgi:hypothetical protein
MNDKKDLDFPVFTIIGDKNFDEEIKELAYLYTSIQDLSIELLEDTNDIKSIGKKLNMYVNNIINRDEPFDYEEHIIVFDKDKNLCIYTHEEVEKFLDDNFDDNDDEIEDEDDFLDLIESFDEETDKLKGLPSTDDKYKLKKKQLDTCEFIVDAYNVSYLQYECNILELEDMNNYYNTIIEEIKEGLIDKRCLNGVSNNNFEDEVFDDKIHELLLTKNTTKETWNFVYIRRKDHNKFMKLLDKNNPK